MARKKKEETVFPKMDLSCKTNGCLGTILFHQGSGRNLHAATPYTDSGLCPFCERVVKESRWEAGETDENGSEQPSPPRFKESYGTEQAIAATTAANRLSDLFAGESRDKYLNVKDSDMRRRGDVVFAPGEKTVTRDERELVIYGGLFD